MVYVLFSQNNGAPIEFFDKLDKEHIKSKIIEHLSENKSDVVEFCKEYPKNDYKRQLGYEIISFYQVNPKNGKIGLVITKNGKDYYRTLTTAN